MPSPCPTWLGPAAPAQPPSRASTTRCPCPTPPAERAPARRPAVHHAHPRVRAARPGRHRAGAVRLDARARGRGRRRPHPHRVHLHRRHARRAHGVHDGPRPAGARAHAPPARPHSPANSVQAVLQARPRQRSGPCACLASLPLRPASLRLHTPHPQVWDDAVASKCEIDCRLCTTLVEVCGRKGDTDRALEAYAQVRAPAGALSCFATSRVGGRAGAALRAAWSTLSLVLLAGHARCLSSLGAWLSLIMLLPAAAPCCLQMRDAPRDSRMAPSVHAFTAAMRAAAEGGRWEAALAIWDDMQKAGCKPTGACQPAPVRPAWPLVLSAAGRASNRRDAAAGPPHDMQSLLPRPRLPCRPCLRRRHLRLRRGRPVAAGGEPVRRDAGLGGAPRCRLLHRPHHR